MSEVIFPERLSIAWLGEQYRSNRLTPREVIEEIIRRSARDTDMNIWITPPSIEWLEPYLEGLQSLDPEQAPLWGVPFAIKDNIDLAGTPTTAACPEYAYTPDEHASVVGRLIAAGGIPVGKSNLDQFATGLVGTRSPHGETHNSLKPELISGGSSGGSAVAVARGQAAFSLGTDTAGSGRVPAALNRLVGYKPSLGAWPTRGVVPACASLDCVTVFATGLEDALAVDRVARGIDYEDPWSRDIQRSNNRLPEALLLPKRTPEFYGPYADLYEQAWKKAVFSLEKLGIPVRYIDTTLFAEAAAVLYDGPMVAERWADLGGFVESHPDTVFPVTETILRSGASPKYTASSVFQAMHKLQQLKLEVGGLMKNAVLVMPTCGGTWSRDQVRENPIATNSDMGRYTNHCNLLDLSAVAVPAGEAGSDLPFGITFFALADSEELICGAAELLNPKSTQPASVPAPAPPPSNQTVGEGNVLLAVCGLHMRGFPLEAQMLSCGASFLREVTTAAQYRMVRLEGATPKPGLLKVLRGGDSLSLEVWTMPSTSFGTFVASIPAPLGIGRITLMDGSEVSGFLCESYAAESAEDITSSGGWRQAVRG
ncbi:allophanate hydrolase [Paenibacillus wynnii]|uniref:allophanate hydrolase n=1 Tax=Paenibacillus wynnii TaxID=268407 RepID=UPI00278D946F|nr:allophanate hydrolase [Paenibacillus wynnii]MDQ0194163.1 allophanate hydrolase [Paenibacillus wynnii]